MQRKQGAVRRRGNGTVRSVPSPRHCVCSSKSAQKIRQMQIMASADVRSAQREKILCMQCSLRRKEQNDISRRTFQQLRVQTHQCASAPCTYRKPHGEDGQAQSSACSLSTSALSSRRTSARSSASLCSAAWILFTRGAPMAARMMMNSLVNATG